MDNTSVLTKTMNNNYSVLMTVYKNDSPDQFRESIDSMMNQTIKTNDFVLVCDGELTDELYKCIDEYKDNFPDLINVVQLPINVGLGTALREGLQHCKNELVARMDSDDVSRPERCEIEFHFLEKNNKAVLVGSAISEFEDNPKNPVMIKSVPVGRESIKRYSRRRNPFNHSSVMFRKTAVEEAGSYSEMRTNQDVELWIRMINTGYYLENISEVLVDFRLDSNTLKRRKKWMNIKLMIILWKRFWKLGYCKLIDFLIVTTTQLIIYVTPVCVLRWIYTRFR